MANEREQRKCVIIGSGPAGYTAAIYTARADMKPLLYEGMQPGGQLTITTEVENFPGYPQGVTGPVLMEDLKKQAERFGTEIRFGFIDKVDFSKAPYLLTDDSGREILAETVIIATGASARWIGLPSEDEYNGFGVSACATCDGFFYKGKTVAVIGGGDTATEEAAYLSNLASKVYLIHRRDELRASKAMQRKVFKTPNIEMVWNAIPKEIVGESKGFAKAVTGIIVTDTKTGEERTIPVDGVFVAIGHTPNTQIFAGQIELHDNGYIKTVPGTTQTNIPGVFAAGDVQDLHYRQAITAAGSGCMAAIEAERYLSMKE
ncbi:Thioredoxin reductase [bioreactor metagenome]|uniref:Thioredoxin reductase n=1 Tax=bioreactor metagenome TaxID=1076179 RepID=A0A644WAR9_9ZZZZ